MVTNRRPEGEKVLTFHRHLAWLAHGIWDSPTWRAALLKEASRTGQGQQI